MKRLEIRKHAECEVRNFQELMTWAAPIIGEYRADDFYPGIVLSANADWENNLSLGVTDRGYVVIVNRGEDFDFDQWRLMDDSKIGTGDPYNIRWDEIESFPAEWLVSEGNVRQAVNYWIAHQEMVPQLNWVSTET